MPELPEVEVTRRALSALVGGMLRSITFSGKNLRVAYPSVSDLPGRPLNAVGRRGKYLLWQFHGAPPLISHLGMSGRYRITADNSEAVGKHDHAVFTFADGRRALYCDPRRFGGFLSELPGQLGPEPFEADPAVLQAAAARKSGAIKTLLLDQHFIVGAGNIYASEALWRAGIHPERAASSLKLSEWKALLQGLCNVLREAIEAGGSSFRDFASPSGKGYFQFAFSAYDRAGAACTKCGGTITRIVQTGRSTFYCTGCAQ